MMPEPSLERSEPPRIRIASADPRTNRTLWLLTIFWNLISLPMLFFVPEEVANGNPLALLGLVFPAVGALLLGHALRATWRRRKFGASLLELAPETAHIGRVLNGFLYARFEMPPDKVRLKVVCMRRSKSESDESDRLLWEDARDLSITAAPSKCPSLRHGAPSLPRRSVRRTMQEAALPARSIRRREEFRLRRAWVVGPSPGSVPRAHRAQRPGGPCSL